MKILRCCTHRWEFPLPFLAMRLKPGVRVSSELALHGSFGDVSWKEMRPSVWYRIQDDQVMIFKKINEQGNHLVPCAWSWMNLVMWWGRNVIMTICSIGYYRMMLRVLGVSMLIANSSFLKGDRQPATPKAIFHSKSPCHFSDTLHSAYVHVDRKPCVSPLEHEIEGFFFFTATKVI